MQNGGQTCISIERVYVEAPVYDAFVRKVTEKVRALRQGAPAAGRVDVGAITVRAAARHRRRHVEQARAAGARVAAAARRDDGGRFFEPTVLVDVDHSMACMTEETFGPTLPIMKVADADEAVARPTTRLRARRLGVDAGPRARRGDRPPVRGGRGVRQRRADQLPGARAADGRLEGLRPRRAPRRAGIRKYCRSQALLITRFAPKRELHMFPYKAKTTRLLMKGVRLLYGRGKRD
jgi:hypothetical protein